MTRVPRVAIYRLVEVDPLRSELGHILSYFANFLKVLSLTRCDRVGNVEEGKGLLVKPTVEPQ